MRKLRSLTRRRLVTILSLIFVLALTTTTALAARPRFSSAITFTLSTLDANVAQAASQGFAANLHDDDKPIALVASGSVSDLVEGRKYELEINAKGKAEIVCGGSHYHGSSPKTVDVTATGSAKISPPYNNGNASYQVDVEELKIDTKKACGSGYSNNFTRQKVTILKVMYSSGDVSLFESKSKGKDTVEIGTFALNGHDKDKKVDQVKFSKCKTKDLNVYCKQNGGG
jgi:hypothetical protein